METARAGPFAIVWTLACVQLEQHVVDTGVCQPHIHVREEHLDFALGLSGSAWCLCCWFPILCQPPTSGGAGLDTHTWTPQTLFPDFCGNHSQAHFPRGLCWGGPPALRLWLPLPSSSSVLSVSLGTNPCRLHFLGILASWLPAGLGQERHWGRVRVKVERRDRVFLPLPAGLGRHQLQFLCGSNAPQGCPTLVPASVRCPQAPGFQLHHPSLFVSLT